MSSKAIYVWRPDKQSKLAHEPSLLAHQRASERSQSDETFRGFASVNSYNKTQETEWDIGFVALPKWHYRAYFSLVICASFKESSPTTSGKARNVFKRMH